MIYNFLIDVFILLVIIAAIVTGVSIVYLLYKEHKTTVTIRDNIDAMNLPKNATADMLIHYFEKKIDDIKHKKLTDRTEETIEYYKKELNRLYVLKESLNK